MRRVGRTLERFGLISLVLVLLAAVAACSSSGGSGTDAQATTTGGGLPSETGPIGTPPDGGTPVDGGVLKVMVAATDPGGLDPIKQLGSGQTGLTELTAIYDSLMRYDTATNTYVPQLAESVTPNADSSVYTVKLRPNVKFSDGTPLTAAAVKSGYDRFSGPGSLLVYYAIFPEIVSMETPDDLTLVVNLSGSDPSFPFLLTQSFGLVPSPTAIEKQGAENFNLNPVGAGPFMVKSYTPGVGLSLVRNPNYWGPAPHLAGIDFTWVADDSARGQALASGDTNVIVVSNPVVSSKAFDDGFTGFGWLNYGSPVVSMNMREGKPFADQRARLAVAKALQGEAINTRVFEGLGYPSKDLFPTGLLSSGAAGIESDVEGARTLVQEVKDTTGWDGSFKLLSSPEPSVHDVALSVQAMLNNVGFNASVETSPNWTDQVYVNFDFDAVVTSLAMMETDPYAFLLYEAGGAYSPTGLTDPRLDAAILELRGASNQAETAAATEKIQQIWNEIVPSVWLGHRVDRMYQTANVHGLIYSASDVALFNEAWLSG